MKYFEAASKAARNCILRMPAFKKIGSFYGYNISYNIAIRWLPHRTAIAFAHAFAEIHLSHEPHPVFLKFIEPVISLYKAVTGKANIL